MLDTAPTRRAPAPAPAVQLLDPVDDQRWARLVQGARQGSVFHHPSWLALIARQYGYELSACCLVDEGGRLRARLPFARVSSPLTGRRLVAVPFSDVCPPIADKASARGLEQGLVDLCAEMKL